MIVEFFERNVHAGGKEITENVFSNTLGLRFLQEEGVVINTTRDHCVKDS
jgi:hypothetical protein